MGGRTPLNAWSFRAFRPPGESSTILCFSSVSFFAPEVKVCLWGDLLACEGLEDRQSSSIGAESASRSASRFIILPDLFLWVTGTGQ